MEGIVSGPTDATVAIDGNDVTVEGESVVDDPIGQPMVFTDPATGETIIVVFDMPVVTPVVDRPSLRTILPPL